MNLTLNNIRGSFVHHKFFMLAGLAIIALFAVIVIQQVLRFSKPTYSPPPASQQPVVNGKLNISAQAVQQSKNSLDILKPHLPFNQTITTSTGTKIAYSVFTKIPEDPYDLYIAISNIDFTVPNEDLKLAQTVQDFRDTASSLYDFLTTNGVNPSAIYIVWADNLPNQKTAESWLNPSVDFPSVIKQNGKYIFEK